MASPEQRCYEIVEAVARAPEIALALEQPRIRRGIDLADVEEIVLAADELDELGRIRLLRDVRCLARFYADHTN